MHSAVQHHRMKKGSLGADDIEPPSGPILRIAADFLSQLGDGKESLDLGAFQVVDFNSRVVDDLFVIVHKMEEAAHLGQTPTRTGWSLLTLFADEVKRPSGPPPYSSLVGVSALSG